MKKWLLGIITIIIVQFVVFVYGYGALNNQVQANVKQVDDNKCKIEVTVTKQDLKDVKQELTEEMKDQMANLKDYMAMLHKNNGNSL